MTGRKTGGSRDAEKTTFRGEEQQDDQEDDGDLYSSPPPHISIQGSYYKEKSGQIVRLET
jgi:hypothetical protein